MRHLRFRYLPVSQLALRTIALLACLASLVVAIHVSVNLHNHWYLVYVSTLFALCIDTAEVTALSTFSPNTIIPRFPPGLLATADLIALGLLGWSMSRLAYDNFVPGGDHNHSKYDGVSWQAIEIYLAATIGFFHFALMVLDFIECYYPMNVRRSSPDDTERIGLR